MMNPLLRAILCALLATLAARLPAAPGEVPGVTVHFADGLVIEKPTGAEERLIQTELYPGREFLQPLEPSSLDEFRRFYTLGGLRLGVTPEQLRDIDDRAERDPRIKAQLAAVIAEAEGVLGAPPPRYQPCPEHWSRAPGERARKVEERSAALAAMRRSCALAFALTGEECFAKKAWDTLAAAIEHFYTYGVFRMPYPPQSPWDAGHELYAAAAAYDLIATWEGMRPPDHALVFTYLRRLGLRVAYAVEFSEVIGNRQAMWTCNLGCLTRYAPQMPEAKRWRTLVDRRMGSVMADFMTDGGQIESDPEMHAFALTHIIRHARLAAKNGDPDSLRRKWGANGVTIESAVDWLAKIATPLGHTPAINDSTRRPVSDCACYLDAINAFRRGDWLSAGKIDPSNSPLLHLIDDTLEPKAPAYASILLPDTGFAVMRDGWDERDNYLLLDYGRHGGARGHLDKMNIVLYADGQPWVLDAGPSPHAYLYPREHEDWHRQTLAHNTVLVDGDSQRPVDGTLVAWHTQAEFDVAAAEHTGYPGLTHRRTVFHPRDGYFLIFDELANSLPRARELQWLVHVHGRRESGTVGRVVFWRDGGHGLLALPAEQRGLRGVRISQGLCTGTDGRSAVVLSGAGRPGDPGWSYIPYVGLKKVAPPEGKQTFCVALIPFEGKEPRAQVRVLDTPLAYVAEVRIGDIRDRVLIRRRGAPDGMARGMSLATDGDYAFVREVAGKSAVLEWVGGTSLSVQAGD